MPLRLSVLDQSPIAAGATAADAVEATIALAQTADAHGYHRFWVAEHHATPMLAGCAPEVLIGPIARATQRIRVGSGGVMLPHYSPFKIAESFRLLSALAPGRIDLGIGRAPGTDGLTAFALQRDRTHRAPDDFPKSLAELLAYLDDSLPAHHPFAGLARTLPGGGGGSPAPPGCSAARRTARIGRRRSGCLIASPISSTRTAPSSPGSIARISGPRRGSPSRM